jgi:hypothetical protein
MLRIELPTLHPEQVRIYLNRTKRNAVRCGRRFGKTVMMVTIAADGVAKGKKIGLFAPEHKQLQEPYGELLKILAPIKSRASKNEGTIRSITGGLVDFWVLNDNELAARGREYDIVMVDEAAFTKDGQMGGEFGIWEKAVLPTLLTTGGDAWLFSTPNGNSPDNFFYWACKSDKSPFRDFHAPSNLNPKVTLEEFEKKRLSSAPQVFEQEYLANFVDWSGVAVFDLAKMLVGGLPVAAPAKCDFVFCVVDSASKDGAMHDGTAITFFARNLYYDTPLIILDWDIVQITGDLLEVWLPQMIEYGARLAAQCGARRGFLGAFVEDKNSGTVLIQKMANAGYPVVAINTKLTALGKEARALSCSDYVHQEMVKISSVAYDKSVRFKGGERNHFITQFCGFRMGQKHGADDLLDTGSYGILLGLGDSEGF